VGMSGVDASSANNELSRVLVVDDEPSICRAFTIALAGSGYLAVSARSGEAALEVLRAQHIDVLLVDLHMGDMRGDTIFEHAAALQPHLRSQTLFMTGDITDHAQQLIAECNCNYLRKPFDLQDMIDAVGSLSPTQHGRTA
jgi:two-component system cell cycle response regulator CpdR